MSVFWTLVKFDFINLFTGYSKKRKSARIKLGYFASMVLALLLYAYMGTVFTLPLVKLFKQMGNLDLLLHNALLLSLFMGIVTGVYIIANKIFESKDTELLLAMPIKFSTIILSRLFSVYTISALILACFYLPSVVLYQLNSSFNLRITIVNLVLVLLLALLVMIIAFVFAFLINLLKSVIRNRMVYTVLYIVLTLIFMAGVMAFQLMADDLARMESFLGHAGGLFDFMTALGYASQVSYLGFLALAAIIILAFSLFVIYFSRNFVKISTGGGQVKKKKNYQLKTVGFASPSLAILKKDMRKFFYTPIWILNTILIQAMVLAGAVYLNFIQDNELVSILGQADLNYELIIGLVIGLSSLMVPINAINISVEGYSLWILHEAPLGPRKILSAKRGLQLALYLPLHILSYVLLITGLKLDFEPLRLALGLLLLSLLSIFSANLAIIINLWVPKFDYQNDTALVKRSFSVLLCMLATVVVGAFYYFFVLAQFKKVDSFLVLGMSLLLFLASELYLHFGGVRRFSKLGKS